MTFAEGAGRLAALAAVLLGWRPAEFWEATPAELAAVMKMLAGQSGASPDMDAAALSALKERFPDG